MVGGPLPVPHDMLQDSCWCLVRCDVDAVNKNESFPRNQSHSACQPASDAPEMLESLLPRSVTTKFGPPQIDSSFSLTYTCDQDQCS